MTTDASWVGAMPEIYDRCLGPALFEPFAARVAAAAASYSPARLLEIAAGTGIGTAELARAMPTADILATDLNPAMVAWASQHVAGVSWAVADAQSLSFPDASFDVVICQFGVMFFPDRPAAFAEAARVLAPGGTMLLTVWGPLEASDFPAALVASLADVLPEDSPTFVARVPHGYADPERIRQDLRAGGLEAERIEELSLRGASPSARELARGFCLGTPLRFELDARGSLVDLSDAIADRMTIRLGEGPIQGDLMAYLITAHRSAD
jgi:SAM-dependent methyltransferase